MWSIGKYVCACLFLGSLSAGTPKHTANNAIRILDTCNGLDRSIEETRAEFADIRRTLDSLTVAGR